MPWGGLPLRKVEECYARGGPAPQKSRGMLCQGGPALEKSRGMLCQGAPPLRKVEECYARGALPCHVAPCCATPCCAAPCRAAPRWAARRRARPRCAAPCCAVLRRGCREWPYDPCPCRGHRDLKALSNKVPLGPGCRWRPGPILGYGGAYLALEARRRSSKGPLGPGCRWRPGPKGHHIKTCIRVGVGRSRAAGSE